MVLCHLVDYRLPWYSQNSHCVLGELKFKKCEFTFLQRRDFPAHLYKAIHTIRLQAKIFAMISLNRKSDEWFGQTLATYILYIDVQRQCNICWNSILKKILFSKGMADPTVNLIYEFTNNTVEWMTRKLLFVFRILLSIFLTVPAILSLYDYVASGYSDESFQQAYPASWVLSLPPII